MDCVQFIKKLVVPDLIKPAWIEYMARLVRAFRPFRGRP